MQAGHAADMARYTAIFQRESLEHLDEVDAALLALERGEPTGDGSDHIASLFRGMHTIKGMAAAMGYGEIEQLAHALESRCEPLREGREEIAPDLLSLLFDGTAALRLTVDRMAIGHHNGEQEDRDTAVLLTRLRRVPVTIATVDSNQNGQASSSRIGKPESAIPGTASRTVTVRLADDCPLKGARAFMIVSRLEALGVIQATRPPRSAWYAEGFNGHLGVILRSDAKDDALVEAARSVGETVEVMVCATSAEALVSTPPVRTVRLDARRLDTLLDLVGELVISRDRLLRAVESAGRPDRQLLAAVRDSVRLVSVLQDEVTQIRLQPVAQVFDRFPRLVRDLAHELRKEVDFVLQGREIEVDRALLDLISEPILHLLRNALDHGLEDAPTRLSAGKPAAGRLVLRAFRDRYAVVVQVQDDGRGIDRQAVQERARPLGLIADDVTLLTDDVLLSLVSRAGFSTSESVTRLSGRGVGVDVVNTRIRSFGGRLELETSEGVGTTFTMRMPATLAISRALLVDVQGVTFALPVTNVVEILPFRGFYGPGIITHQSGRGHAVTVRDEIVPIVALGACLGLVGSSSEQNTSVVFDEDTELHLVIVETAGRRSALLVDGIAGQQDIVIRPLDMVMGALPWFAGTTVLGDGTPTLIVDVANVTALAASSVGQPGASRHVSCPLEEGSTGEKAVRYT